MSGLERHQKVEGLPDWCVKVKVMNKIKLIFASLAIAAVAATVAPAQTVSGQFRDSSGRAVGVDQLRGRVVVLFFGGTIDPQSPEELPVIQRLASRYAGRGVDVYWVSLDEASVSDAQLASYAAKYGYSGGILRDPSGAVLKTVATGRRAQLPTVVVLDPSGAIVGRPMGGFDPQSDHVNRIAAVIDPLLQ